MSDRLKSSIQELSLLMARQPENVDHKLLKEGQKIISIFSTQNFGSSIQTFGEMMLQMHLEAAADLANGGALLTSEKVGIALQQENLIRFSIPTDDDFPHSLGKVVCCIVLKKAEKKPKTPPPPLTQEEINSGIYFLTYRISKLQNATS